MVDALAIREVFSLESAAWIAVALLFLFVVRMWNGAPAMLEQWIAYRRAKAEERAADWTRIREHCSFLMEAEKLCRSELNEVKGRLATLEGYMSGTGRAAQEAAGIVAIERLGRDDKKKSEKPDG